MKNPHLAGDLKTKLCDFEDLNNVDDFSLLQVLRLTDTVSRLPGDGGEMPNDGMLARLGGDEFIVLLPETPAKGALEVAGRIADAIAKNPYALAGTVAAGGLGLYGLHKLLS